VRPLALALGLGWLVVPLIVIAGGLRDLEDAWLIPTARLRTMLTSAEAPPRRWFLTVAQGRLYDLAELPQLGIAAGYGGSNLQCRVAWERLGRSLYREDQARLEVLVGPTWRVGFGAGVDQLDLGEPELRRAFSLELRIRGALPNGLSIDVWWPLTEAPTWYGRQGLRRWLRLDGGGKAGVWSAAVDVTSEGTPTVQGEAMLRLAAAGALGLRFEPWSGAAGFTMAWRLGPVLWRSSHLVHPDLGTSHRWSFDLGGGS